MPSQELRPRLCHIKKGPNGYGFNLHSDKSRPGQYVRAVDPNSPAEAAGLRAQDRIVEVGDGVGGRLEVWPVPDIRDGRAVPGRCSPGASPALSAGGDSEQSCSTPGCSRAEPRSARQPLSAMEHRCPGAAGRRCEGVRWLCGSWAASAHHAGGGRPVPPSPWRCPAPHRALC